MSHFALNQQAPELLGVMIKVVTEGLIQALRARGEVREQFRITRTMVKQRDNNPLKFSMCAEDALENFFLKSGKAYLGVAESYEQAFADLSKHELAVIRSMQIAFESMLEAFSPEHLLQEMEPLNQTMWQKVTGNTNYWERYEAYYQDLKDNTEKSFRTLFGEPFSDAYEEEVSS
jgi:type VI secretion system FHA domain protein